MQENTGEILKDTHNARLKKQWSFERLFFDAQSLYLSGDYMKDKNVYWFQAYYLILYEKFGAVEEFFCKRKPCFEEVEWNKERKEN